MKLTVAPEGVLERVAMALGAAPVPLMDTHVSFIRARAIMVATRLGLFDALMTGPLSAADLADRCGADRTATEKLLNALVGCQYLRRDNARYQLSPRARKWMVRDSRTSLRDKILFEFIEWGFVERLEHYIRTGEPLELHRAISEQDWGFYQRAMRALAALGAPEVVRRTPVPHGATALLDIGGSHGFLSVSMCRRHPRLKATVLDLPEAVKESAPILAVEGMDDRVTHWAADALVADLGTDAWDIVLTSQLLHHLSADANQTLAARVARALRAGGVFAVLEITRPSSPEQAGQVGLLLDLYFALTSRSGTWSIEQITEWLRGAGLVPERPLRLRTVPGAVEVVARKPL
jgi:SAM-dependent methyltransferase